MSRETRDRVWENSKFGGSQKLLLLALAERSDAAGVSFPGAPLLCEMVDISEARLKAILNEVEAAGHIISLASGGRHNGNTYFVTIGLQADQIAAILMSHPRLKLDEETALFLAQDSLERVLKPIPLNRQKRVLDLSEKGIGSEKKGYCFEKERVLDPSGKGIENNIPYNVEPSLTVINRQRRDRAHEKPVPLSMQKKNQNPAPEISEKPTRGELDGPVVEGVADPRFKHPLFLAVCNACDVDLSAVSFLEKSRTLAVSSSLENAGYSPEQISLAASRWPYPTAPTPRQLQDRIRALLNQKENQNGTNSSNGLENGSRHTGRQSERQRLAAERAELSRELAARFGGH